MMILEIEESDLEWIGLVLVANDTMLRMEVRKMKPKTKEEVLAHFNCRQMATVYWYLATGQEIAFSKKVRERAFQTLESAGYIKKVGGIRGLQKYEVKPLPAKCALPPLPKLRNADQRRLKQIWDLGPKPKKRKLKSKPKPKEKLQSTKKTQPRPELKQVNGTTVIPTRYAGYHFRSRLEARWAVFFDAVGIDWQYEPEGYSTPDGPYLPDFILSGPKGLSVCEVKARPMTDTEWKKLEHVMYAIEAKCACQLGPIKQNKSETSGFKWFSQIGDYNEKDINAALAAARSARFEHGESGAT